MGQNFFTTRFSEMEGRMITVTGECKFEEVGLEGLFEGGEGG